jgi:hypothetical protein
MKDRLESFPFIRIFCQNVNRNYSLTDTLLSSLYENYDLLFIQEPPWRLIRNAPSSTSRDDEPVISMPLSPFWDAIVWPSGLDSPPRMAVFVNSRIASLKPAYRRDLFDHRDILIFSLGLGEGIQFYANVYSDDNHTVISLLHEQVVDIPKLHVMCGDFNVLHWDWDPMGPETNIHAERLVAVAEAASLAQSLPIVPGPTHFPYNTDLSPTVIDLMFVANYVAVATSHEICPEDRGSSDHAPLIVVVPGSSSLVLVTKWSITPGSDKELAYCGEVLEALQPLLDWNGNTQHEIQEVVEAISNAFASA